MKVVDLWRGIKDFDWHILSARDSPAIPDTSRLFSLSSGASDPAAPNENDQVVNRDNLANGVGLYLGEPPTLQQEYELSGMEK
jgi:hypothetical protein